MIKIIVSHITINNDGFKHISNNSFQHHVENDDKYVNNDVLDDHHLKC